VLEEMANGGGMTLKVWELKFHGGFTGAWTTDLLQNIAATWTLHTAFMTYYLFYWHSRRAFIKSKATNG
jgi:hypothetical protein